jgi:uncharacterized coiled-coil protein SlyX
MAPLRIQDEDGGRPNGLLARIDESTPVGFKLSVLLSLVVFIVTSTWWAAEVRNDLVRKIDAANARNAAQEDHLRSTDATVAEIRRSMERMEAKLDDINAYLRASRRP